MAIKALLVAVCDYPGVCNCSSLPLCKNDLYAMQNALIKGLNADVNDIELCGETGIVDKATLVETLHKLAVSSSEEDTFIFYFSGHGGKNILALSDGLLDLQQLIDTVEKITTKNKIVFLDCCHAGGVSVNSLAQLDIGDSIEAFVGYGYAVMASCGAEETSGFNTERKMSLYTSFLCDSLTNRYLIKKGQKSLEMINEAVCNYASSWNKSGKGKIQQPIFRSNIGGTIFFNVEEYHPYSVAKVYGETESYIIYGVNPLHNAFAKRLAVKVILRFQCSMEQIANIASEVREKVLYCEVYQNEIAEAHHSGKSANIVWCHFGYDEDDMVDGNFICRTTWVDDTQDKSWWYRTSKNTASINGVHVEVNNSYDMIKNLKDDSVDKDKLIQLTREYSAKLISAAEQQIKYYREYLNSVITEDQLINSVEIINKEIAQWFFKQSDLPIPPRELHEWANAHIKIANTIHDLSLFYNKKNLSTWPSENRRWLMSDVIKRYEVELEELRDMDRII